MSTQTLILYLAVLLAVSVLAANGKISGETWLALVAGSLLPSPISGRRTGPATAMLLLAILPACNGNRIFSASPAPVVVVEVQPQAGIGGDYVLMKPQATNPLAAGKVGLWASSVSSPNDVYLVDASGNSTRANTARRLLVSAGAPSGTPTNGDVYFDSGTGLLNLYVGGWSAYPAASGLMTLGTTQTVTGDKTFTGALILPATNTPAQTADASIVWDANDDLLTVGTGATRKTMLDTDSSQAATNKTLTAPVINGATSASGNFDLSGSSGTTKTTTGTNTLSGNVVIPTGKTATLGAAILWGAVTDRLNAAILAFASQAVGDLPYADTTTTMARLAAVATGSVLGSAGVATAPAWVANGNLTGLYAQGFIGHASGALTGAATKYLMISDAGGEAAAQRALWLDNVPTATMQPLVMACVVGTAPSAGESCIFTLQKSSDQGGSYSDTTTTCTISDTGKTCSDSTHHATFAQFDLAAIKVVNSAGPGFAAANAHCTVQVAK